MRTEILISDKVYMPEGRPSVVTSLTDETTSPSDIRLVGHRGTEPGHIVPETGSINR